jgi:hypothetical protein
MRRREFLKGVAATGLPLAMPARAQGVTEIAFFYPVAVGGPITKLIDALAAEFERQSPGIKVKPIYAGTYQETVVKALTAHKSGNPPAASVLLLTDMFTLIDEDAVVAIDEFVRSDADRAWLESFCRLAACLPVDSAAAVRGVDGGAPARVLGALHAAGAADARELRDCLEGRALCSLLPQHLPARHHDSGMPARPVHARSLCLCPP